MSNPAISAPAPDPDETRRADRLLAQCREVYGTATTNSAVTNYINRHEPNLWRGLRPGQRAERFQRALLRRPDLVIEALSAAFNTPRIPTLGT